MSVIKVQVNTHKYNQDYTTLKQLCIQLDESVTNRQLDEIINTVQLIKQNKRYSGGGENVGNRNVDISELLNEYVLSLNPSSCSIIPEVKKTNNINGGSKLTTKKYKKTLKRH